MLPPTQGLQGQRVQRATITIELGTPTSTAIAANELDPVTWAGAGTRSLSVAINTTEVLGNAKLGVT
jgi:hypothetical protein